MSRNLHDKLPGAKNFIYLEFVRSDTAIRKNIPNVPSDYHWKNIEALARNVLQPIRNKFGPINITSGYRSAELCIAVGSNPNSNHARGEAADFEPGDPNIKLFDVLEWIHKNCEYRELIAEYFPHGWIHVAFREGENIRQLKLKDANHNYTIVTIEELRKLYGG